MLIGCCNVKRVTCILLKLNNNAKKRNVHVMFFLLNRKAKDVEWYLDLMLGKLISCEIKTCDKNMLFHEFQCDAVIYFR